MPIGIGPALILSGLLGAGSSIFGGLMGYDASKAGVAAEENMFNTGLNVQSGYLKDASSTLNPLIQSGQNSLNWYDYLTGTGTNPNGGGTSYNPLTAPLTAPFTAGSLTSTPGYQFTLGQGLKSTQNSFAAQGLAGSGAALKGAASYATGLADSTYNQQFSNYLQQNQQIANLLLGPAGLGATAAETMAQLYGNAGNAALSGAIGTGANIASSTVGGANALAAGATGASGGIGNALSLNALLTAFANKNAATPTVGPTAGDSYVNNALMSSGGAPSWLNPNTGYGLS